MWGSAGWLDKGEDPRWGVELAHNRTTNTEVFMSHTNAVLTPTGRLRLARPVVDDGWVLRRAAARFRLSVTTAPLAQAVSPLRPCWDGRPCTRS